MRRREGVSFGILLCYPVREECADTQNDERKKTMKEYKMVYLNKGFSTSREKDLIKAEEKINEMTEQGWELQEVVSPSDGVGALIGVFFQERKL